MTIEPGDIFIDESSRSSKQYTVYIKILEVTEEEKIKAVVHKVKGYKIAREGDSLHCGRSTYERLRKLKKFEQEIEKNYTV